MMRLFFFSLAFQAAAQKFLLISSPKDKKVQYAPVDYAGKVGSPADLINEGLVIPRGLCVDQARNLLYIADAPAAPEEPKVWRYELRIDGNALRTVGPGVVAHTGNQARWCAVDGVGDLFLTDEAKQEVLRVPYGIATGKPAKGDAVKTVYGNANGANPRVSAPGGVAVDNFNVYWTNKVSGAANGSVVKGLELPPEGVGAKTTELVLAQNVQTSYGVALTQRHVFYSDKDLKVYGVPKGGGTPVEVTRGLTEPRGIAYDGDGTVFVADAKMGGVYSFAGNMQVLEPTLNLLKVADVNDAYGVAVLESSALRSVGGTLVSVLVGMWLLV